MDPVNHKLLHLQNSPCAILAWMSAVGIASSQWVADVPPARDFDCLLEVKSVTRIAPGQNLVIRKRAQETRKSVPCL